MTTSAIQSSRTVDVSVGHAQPPRGTTAWNTGQWIGEIARSALLAEVLITPKPGLVDRNGCGAHRDMDLGLFRVSIDAISPWFDLFAQVGLDFCGDSPVDLFPPLQVAGKRAEAAMFAATGGVNTHKGLVFSLGLLCGAAGYLFRQKGCDTNGPPSLSPAEVCETAAAISAGIVHRHFADLPTRRNETYGERIYRMYGQTGARGEAEAGFPHVVRWGLPLLGRLIEMHGKPAPFPGAMGSRAADRIGVSLLLGLMCIVPDTNILGRHGPEILEMVRCESHAALAAGAMFTAAGRRKVHRLTTRFRERNISPGGSADLLAVTLFLHNLSI